MRNYGAKGQVKNGDYLSLGTYTEHDLVLENQIVFRYYSQAFRTKGDLSRTRFGITKSKRLDYNFLNLCHLCSQISFPILIDKSLLKS
jgi:hypothetical protein